MLLHSGLQTMNRYAWSPYRYIPPSISFHLSPYLSPYLSIHNHPSISLSIPPSISLSIPLSSPYLYPSIYLPIYPSITLFIYPSSYQFIHLAPYLSLDLRVRTSHSFVFKNKSSIKNLGFLYYTNHRHTRAENQCICFVCFFIYF